MSRECHGIVTCYLGITLGDLLLLRIVCVERMEAEDVAMYWRMLDIDGPTGWNGWRWRHEHAAPGRPRGKPSRSFHSSSRQRRHGAHVPLRQEQSDLPPS